MIDLEDRSQLEDITLEEAKARFRREDAAALAQREARERWPETYGGTWIDVEDSFDVIVAFTEDVSEKVNELRTDFPEPERLRGIQAELSLRELLDRQQHIVEDRNQLLRGRRPQDLPDLIAGTGGNYGVGVDARNGRIVVDVDGASPELERQFSSYYTIPVHAEEDAGSPECTISDCRPRILGGTAFNICTVGFGVTRSGNPESLSAGHCSGTGRSHGGTFYGNVAQSIFEGRTDAQRIPQSQWGWNHSNFIGVVGEPLREITNFFRVNDYTIGMYVGKTGKTTGTTRGYIDHLTYAPSYVPNSTATFIKTDYCSDGGDSGAPVFRNNSALGVHSGSAADCAGIFGRIHYATWDLGVSLMTSDFNDAPQARFSASCNLFTCSFDGRASRDIDGSISSYSWNFGDAAGSSGSGSTAQHTYLLPGTYTVRLTVRDNGGKTDTTTRQVTVP